VRLSDCNQSSGATGIMTFCIVLSHLICWVDVVHKVSFDVIILPCLLHHDKGKGIPGTHHRSKFPIIYTKGIFYHNSCNICGNVYNCSTK